MVVNAYFVLRLFIPVWRAAKISNLTQESLSSGIILGLVYGFVSTLAPLLLDWHSRYKKVSWPWKSVISFATVVLAIPNLLTLSIYADSSAAAAKARKMTAFSATWFPSWSLVSAITGVVLFISIAAAERRWRYCRRSPRLEVFSTARHGESRITATDDSARMKQSAQDVENPGKPTLLRWFAGVLTGRASGIRTHGLLTPSQARYQAAP